MQIRGPGPGLGSGEEEKITQLQKQIDAHLVQIRSLEQERATLRTQIDQQQTQITSLQQERTRLQAQVDKLNSDLAKIQAERPRFQLDNFATSFKTMLETLQAPTVTATPSGVQGTLQSIDLEIKGFVDVQGDKTNVTVPKPGDTVDANSLSLVKLSFVTVPTLPPPKT